MVSRRPLACLALFTALLSGCAGRDYRPGGKPVTEHWPGKDSSFNLVPYPGEYVLLRAGESSPVEKRELPRDAAVGFKVLPDGRLVALAGEDAIPLQEGDYRWHLVRVSHWQLARLAVGEVGGEVAPIVAALCVVGVVVLLAGGALLVLSLLPPGSVHLS
jgi:hypothetical protein